MSQTHEVERNSGASGASSRSTSPGSDDIDMEGAPTTSKSSQRQQEHFNAPLSPVSPQKNDSALQAGGSNTASPRVQGSKHAGGQGQGGRQPQQGNKKRPGNPKNDSSGHSRDGSGYSRGATGLMDPAQGSAYERLLDLNYPRDYGDPVLRYDAAMNPGSMPGQQMSTNLAPSTSS